MVRISRNHSPGRQTFNESVACWNAFSYEREKVANHNMRHIKNITFIFAALIVLIFLGRFVWVFFETVLAD